MSRGHGNVERALLGVLNGNPDRHFSALLLSALVYNRSSDTDGNIAVSNAQAAAVRRALSNLRRQGQAFQIGRRYGEPSIGRRTPRPMWTCEQNARAYATRTVNTFGRQGVSKELLQLI
jgi:hypothetical protein